MADEENQVEEGKEDAVDQDEDGDGEEGAEGEEGADGKKGSKKKLLLMVLVAVVLIVAGGAGAYFMGYLDSFIGKETAEDGEHAEGGAQDGHAKEGDHGDKKKESHGKAEGGHGDAGGDSSAFLAIPTMIVNLNTEDGTPRYLRLTVQLELDDPSEKAEVEAVIPRVIDQFQTYLRELRVRDLRGSAGIYRLQMELLWRVNQASDPVKIKDVLFQEILIQ